MSELVKVVTPVGELFYVNISGQGKQNYNEDGYEYVASIRLTGEKAEKLIGEINEVAKTMPAGLNLKSKGYRELVQDASGNLRSPTNAKPKTDEEKLSGVFEFLFKTNATYADGKAKKINVYNKNAKIVDIGDSKIGNGSKGAISGKMQGSVYKKDFSVSLYLNSVQLTEFHEYVGDAGFDAQEGDFDGVVDKESGFTGQAEAEPSKEKVKPKL